MRRFPDARNREFEQLLAGLEAADLARVYDIPAGGGYLRRFIAPQADLVEFEPSSHFGSDRARWVDLEQLDLEPASADLVVSLAALHHVANKAEFFETCLNALKRGGWFCVGDPPAGSRIARFLDGFVGAHNGTGHAGDYLDLDTGYFSRLGRGRARLTRCEIAPCPWHFSGSAEMAAFCRDLFGLDGPGDAAILEALERHIGVQHRENGVSLEWELLYLRFQSVQEQPGNRSREPALN